jgi:hypothetical protein
MYTVTSIKVTSKLYSTAWYKASDDDILQWCFKPEVFDA